ncbi:BTAD domain-containing putative transcriptional regulator [Actinomadura rudentiformis]|uniref:AAA family ATPase n=1 Tax=Actinomadura rudentiformis TaxID=359158 RepID=A0A6H9Z0V4_9ACTN|nr:BTAD domain-containing putative transcriptional regulator [Actinomadura rudentiformis]KAB2347511.1 AAA family ATPase [Actinomadura rudentiformis]
MRFGVLGPLEVWTDGGERVRVPDLKVRALLADLLVHQGRAVPADRLIDDLWGDQLPANPAATLQARVSQLRKVLAGAEDGARALVVSRLPGYALRIEAGALDAERFEELVERARKTGDPRAWGEALALWRGDAYADFGDAEFARTEIDRLEELRLTAIEEWSETTFENGSMSDPMTGSGTGFGTAFGTAEFGALVAAHPLRERLRAAYMRALYRAGRQSEALASFQDLRERLRDELGLDPGPELVALQRSILHHEARARTNLPAPVSELVGRAEAVRDVRALLRKGRLVTLTGPGGVGKTRLAVESARGLEEEYADGVRLIELTALGDPSVEGAASAVAASLGLRDEAAVRSAPAARLLDALAGRRMLLILDNCEHVIEPVAALAAQMLPAAPEVRLLATSQEPLGISGEQVWSVPPLETPSAVELFVTRAAAAAPGFGLGPGDAEAVAAICRRLDGLPLALELAATRVRAMDVAELADRLHDRFRLLSAGRRDAPARQRTLRAMIDWSWEPLSEPERAVLRRLAVHVDGCTLEAAEQVCAGDGIEPGEVLDLLARLVDRSLVVRADGRYRLLESVAAYCAERLEEVGERTAVLRRRDRYYTELAERAEPHLRGRDQRRWLDRLNAETANLRAVIRESEPETALRLVNALTWYWFLSGRLDEARRVLTSVLSRAANSEGGPASARGRASAWLAGFTMLEGEGADRTDLTEQALDGLCERRAEVEWLLGFVRTGFGDVPAIDELLTRALAGFTADGDRWGQAAVLVTRAGQAMARGELAAVSRDGEQAMGLFRDAGDRWGLLQATEVLGVLAEAVGDYERAAQLHRDGLAMAEELGSYAEVSYKLSRLGRIALLSGDHAEAAELHERARQIAAEQSHKRMEQFAEIGLALVARRRGDLDAAERYLRTWVGWIREVDGAPGLAFVLAELGFVAEQRGDARRAAELHSEGLAAARSTGNPRAVALALEGLAGAAALDGRAAEAARLLGEAAAARAAAGASLPPAERGDVDRITAVVRGILGEEDFHSAFTGGFASGRTPSATA